MERCLYPAWLFQFFASLNLVLKYLPDFEHWLRVQTVIFPSNLIWRKHHISIWSVSATCEMQIGLVQSKSTKNLIWKVDWFVLQDLARHVVRFLPAFLIFIARFYMWTKGSWPLRPSRFYGKGFCILSRSRKYFKLAVFFWTINKNLWKSFCQTALRNSVGNPMRIRSQLCVSRTELLKVYKSMIFKKETDRLQLKFKTERKHTVMVGIFTWKR